MHSMSLFTIVQNVLSGIVSIVLGCHPVQSIHALVSMHAYSAFNCIKPDFMQVYHCAELDNATGHWIFSDHFQ